MAPLVGAWLFGSPVAPNLNLVAGYSVAFFCVSAATPLTRNILVPAGKTRRVLGATVLSALVGAASMLAFGANLGAAGLSWSLAGADAVFLVCVILECLRLKVVR
ncbi:hypothetical protein AB4Z14_03535 [Terrabacter sp. 2TAF16]|uniref:hypothetical protein n=1 Tax=Terrabacter sp. 2TAF16 TaxID=3233008 RepID=UPI003F957CDC